MYKRQHQERDGIAAFAAAEAFIYPLRGRHDERRGFLVVERAAGLIAVSYTHLDVYKRQE